MKPTDNPRWITTTEAAEMSGLSRPLVERILGSGDYEGEIRWPAEETHPSVRADEFEAWIKPILSASDPGDLEQMRDEAILDPPPSAKKLSLQEKGAREASRARAAELAKVLSKDGGSGREDGTAERLQETVVNTSARRASPSDRS